MKAMKVRVTSLGAMAVVAIVLVGVISLGIVNAARFNGTFVAGDLTRRHDCMNKENAVGG